MTYQTTITSKGQITIPKPLRELLGLSTEQRIQIGLTPHQNGVVIKPVSDLLTLAKTIKPKHAANVLKARQAFEAHYGRV